MALMQFRVENLKDVDGGRLAAVVNMAMKRLLEDCADRPRESAARKLTLELTFVPGYSDPNTHDLETVYVGYGLKESFPAKKSGFINCSLRKDHTLVFNDLAPDNAAQRTFDEVDGGE